jgi:hypothetical protein
MKPGLYANINAKIPDSLCLKPDSGLRLRVMV